MEHSVNKKNKKGEIFKYISHVLSTITVLIPSTKTVT